MKNIYGFTRKNLEEYFINNNDKAFRATQIYEWLYKKKISSYDEITNINKDVINHIKDDFSLDKIEIVKIEKDKDVKKYLFKLHDDNKIEAVLMFHDYGNSLCISTQVGCNMGCAFCESGRLKKVRNLDTYEMVQQILMVEEDIKKRISHVVLMGIGEPFDNYDNVMSFLRIINDNKGIDIGARHITISTCGVIPKIKDFMEEKMQVNLAISLHAPNDELRSKLVPINKVYNIESLITCIKEYIKKTNRRVTFEYTLLEGINDSEKEALELSSLLREINCYVNLIPYNETSHITFKKSKKMNLMAFYDILKKNHINVTIRREFGSYISAACGQLRASN
jgi:23S rRNA (adenine2503-C2)-methyltransferase